MMGITTLRSLLLAAFLLSNISRTTSRHQFRHNAHGTRHRRQDTGLYHPASYVIPGGEGTGAWGEWERVSPCSRTCGGGVANQKRICLQFDSDDQPLCTGGDTKYFSCETQDCPENADDFRAEQCSEYNKQPFKGSGITYDWVPYTKGPHPCELNCMPREEPFYYQMKAQVVDGTRCDDESFNVCVAGVCQPVGCDMMLGSNAREDQCRNCRGNGSNCNTIEGLLKETDLKLGYNDVLLIPQGATNIFIQEVRASNNYLALRHKTQDIYYLNGRYEIASPKSFMVNGTLWHYERRFQGIQAPDKLRCIGPTTEALYLSILLQETNVGISYKYSVPSASVPPLNKQYNWVHESFSECSATCGGGFQVREVTCRSREELDTVSDILCDGGLKPSTNQTCNIEDCPPRWVEGPWSPCSHPCGDDGKRSREVYCEKMITNRETFRFPSIVADEECFDLLGPKPELEQTCNKNATCPTWFTGPWKPCNRLCGAGKQTRQVVCHQRINGFVQLFEDRDCDGEKPITAKACLLHPCDGVDWVISEWSGCDTCLSTVRTRVAHCATKDQEVIDPNLCSYHPSPVLKEECDRTKLPACQVQWYATQWSNCSVECGTGVRTRRVFCGLFDGASVIKVDDERCDQEYKYNDTTECVVPQEKCPAKWFAGPWSECTKECGGGEQFRRVMCLFGKEVFGCNNETLLHSTQSCNIGPCDKDDLLPIDSKSNPVLDDYDEEDCIEDEEEYPEVGAESYTFSPTVFSDFMYPEDLIIISTTDIPEETGSGEEWSEINSTYTTDATESTETTWTYSTDEKSTSEPDVTISTDSSTIEGADSISTETNESTTIDSTSSSITEVTDSTTENEVLSTENTTTSEISVSSTTAIINSISTETIESSTTDGTSSSITEITEPTTKPYELITSTTSESSVSSTTKNGDSSTKENAASSTTDTDLSSTTESTEFITTEILESSTTESTSSSITKVTDSTTDSEEFSTTESGSTITENGSSTTENIHSTDISSTIKTLSSSITDGSSSSVSGTTENVESTVVTESTDSSTIVSTLYSTQESSDSSITDKEAFSTTEGDLYTTIENGESSTIEHSISTTESDQISTSERALSSTTENSEFSTTENGVTSTTETDSTSTIEKSSKHTTENDESSTTNATPSTSESSISSTTENAASSTTESALSTTSESDISSTTDNVASITTENFRKLNSLEISTTEGSTDSTTAESSTIYSTESSTTESDGTGTSKSTETTETGESSTSPGSTDSTTAESSTIYSTESSTTESDGTGTSGSTETTETEESSTSPGTTNASTSSEEPLTNESSVTETSSTDSTTAESSTIYSTESSTTESDGTGTSGSTETTETGESPTSPGTTDASTPSEEPLTNESSVTETSSTDSTTAEESSTIYSTESSTTESDGTGTTGSTETTETGESSTSPGTTDASTPSEEPLTNESSVTETTPWDWASTVEVLNRKPHCKPRKTAKCTKSKFGCCPDKRTPAAGPFDEGCPNPETCKDSKFGCCSDGVSPAAGHLGKGCPVSLCNETLFGCCSDNVTASEGNNQEGCPPLPPACKSAEYGCCDDNDTYASGPEKQGCPETTEIYLESTETPTTVVDEGCATSEFGCCFDNDTDASGPNREGCPCSISEFGCCPDGLTTASGNQLEGCLMSCITSAYGCCPDGETPAHGPQSEGCCLLHEFGCCPDNYMPAKGPDHEGCGCEYARFGCCTDNITIARGPNMEGCGCEHSRYGCCPDRHTEAQGTAFKGCECHTHQFGCCFDGVTIASGPGMEGCLCERSKYGCCGDKTTSAKGPNMAGCDCSNSQYGCCPDGKTEAGGDHFLNCSNVPVNKQAACALDSDKGTCIKYEKFWFYDMQYGGCSQFWYGGCGGNGNRFVNKAECEDVCVQPSPKDSCKLPKVKAICEEYNVRWYYNSEREQCSQFVYGGCLGNANNFDTKEICQEHCEPEKTEDRCNLALEPGPCAGNFARWGFSAERRRCEQFVWGGCGGNHNRYDSEAACQLQCAPHGKPQQACSLPQDTGNCTEKHPVWSFNQTENRCVPFYYSGCGGNDNRFNTEHSCDDSCPSTYVQEICTLPAMVGDCDHYTQKWFYDTTIQRCRQFYYGGCGGNENNFLSELECENRCSEQSTTTTTVKPEPLQPQTEPAVIREISEICFLDIDTGPCTESHTQWAHDVESGTCVQFQYGGCGGNNNNFPTFEYCQRYCGSTTQPQDVCQLPFVSGPCDQSIMQWFYNAASNSCNQSIYGGCEGNDNRFDTQAECERRCKQGVTTTFVPILLTTTTTMAPLRSTDLIEEDECATPLSLAPCGANVTVYYFDTRTQACLVGDFGSCRYLNSYRTEEECQRRCGAFRQLDVCGYPLDTGPCTNAIPKFYWDPLSGRCLGFAYGGCHGGPNRFSTEDECEEICGATRPEARCLALVSSGTPGCGTPSRRWYYSAVSGECVAFVYSGCGGNDNNFHTYKECTLCKRLLPPNSESETSNEVLPDCDVNNAECAVQKCDYGVQRTRSDNNGCERCQCNDHPCANKKCSSGERCVVTSYRDLDTLDVIYSSDCGIANKSGSCPSIAVSVSSIESSCMIQCYDDADCAGADKCCKRDCSSLCLKPTVATSPAPIITTYTPELPQVPSANSATEPEVRASLGGTATLRCLFHGNPPPKITWRRGQITIDGDVGRYRLLSDGALEIVSVFRNDSGVYICIADNGFGIALQEVNLQVDEIETGNEVLPDCDADNAECAALKCDYGVQRTRSDNSGCERCQCNDHPCANKKCPSGQRCVVTSYRNPITLDVIYSSDCGIANKSGSCPSIAVSVSSIESRCMFQCYDDADCAGADKCCKRDCSSLCLEPAVATSLAPTVTTFAPELPQVPSANSATEPEVRASLGGTATLRCLFHGNPPPKITWQRGQITIDGDVGRYRLLSDGALEIVSVFRNDSGVYICIADNGFGIARQEVNLQVDEIETGNEVLPDCDADNAKCAALKCDYGVQRTRSDNNGCERCQCNDHPCANKKCPSGERCVVSSYRNPITLDVIYSSDCGIANKSGSCPSNAVSVSSGESKCMFQCYDDADCPGVGKCCERDCSMLCLEPAVATSPAPTVTTYAPELPQVPFADPATKPEVNASLGGMATLRCLFHGNPPPKITWRRRHLTIEGDVGRYRLLSDGALEIVSVYHNDSGVYICIANNGLGVARQEVNLQVNNGVEGPAGITGLSDAVVVGELGQPLSVRCMAYGYPPPSINWYRGRKGPMVPFSNVQYEARENVLHIKKLSIDTLGEYVCLTYNGFGKPVDWSITVKAYRIDDFDDSLFLVPRQNEVVTTPRQPQTEATTTIAPEIEVLVYTVPVTTSIVTEQTRLAVGSELSLLCEVDGYPIPDVFWTKDSVAISSDERITVTEFRLTVSRTDINDTGVYGCHAVNAFNSHYSTVQINVEGLYIPPTCNDNPTFANCVLIVRSHFCIHKYYSNFCCKSCVEAGQLDVRNLELQPDNTLYRK